MSNFEDRFKNALATWLQDYHGLDAHDVYDWEQEEESTTCGYETCWDFWTNVTIYYHTSAGEARSYGYSGDLGQLMRELP